MLQISDYTLTQLLYKGNRSLVYRAFNNRDKHLVIVKLLFNEYPPSEQIAQFKQEYEMLKLLDGNGSVRAIELINNPSNNSPVIIMEDYGTHSLRDFLINKRLTQLQFLTLALNIVDQLEKIHQHSIIHKDINPQNILIDEKTLNTKIIDLGIASMLSREEPEIINLRALESTLPYMSPEQTGRMNRGIDYRTDYYSLGIVFYEMVTQTLPFKGDDFLEIVHAHIAKTPVNPTTINLDLSPVIAEIIMKLMAKTAEDRYQSLYGLKKDLLNCLQQLKLNGNINPFPIASHDIATRLYIPEKLYGRQQEVDSLVDAFNRISHNRVELYLVTGFAGVGKTRLIQEIYKPIVEKKGYYIEGKFDQYMRDIPYYAILQALQKFIKQIQSETDEQIQKWRERFLDVLGPNGQVVIDVLPELEAIIGPQPVLPALGYTENQHRFNLVFNNFIHALSSKEHPLAIFLDNLHWADASSLNLLETLLTDPDSHHFILIGAYRENELQPTDQLYTMIEKIKKNKVKITTVYLQPLTLTSVEALLRDTLHTDEETIKPLALICHEKTQGTPFFLSQFIISLYKENLLNFNSEKGRWEWDIEEIKLKNITDNVVDFMVKKVKELNPETQAILQYAACLGNRFELLSLAACYKKTPQIASQILWQALQEGLVVPIDNTYRYISNTDQLNATYQFLHDRVQQAVYLLISKDELEKIHLIISQVLLQMTPENKLKENSLEIANHIIHSISLVKAFNHKEKENYTKVCLSAGIHAKSSIAYEGALNYLKGAMQLLSKDDWEKNYNLTLSVFTEATEAAYLSGHTDEMEEYANTVIDHAENLLDKVKVYDVQISCLTNQNKPVEAIHLSFNILKLFGISLPENPSKLTVLLKIIKMRLRLLFKNTDELYRLPLIKDEHWLAAIRILSIISPAAYLSGLNIFVIVGLENMRLSLKYGLSPYSSVGFALYAFIQCSVLGKIEEGYQFGRLALNMADRLPSNRQTTQIAVYPFIPHWHDHLENSLQPLRETFQRSIELGDEESAGVSVAFYISTNFFLGKELEGILLEINNYLHLFLKIGSTTYYQYLLIYKRVVLQFLGRIEEFEFPSAEFDKTIIELSETVKKGNPGLSYYLTKNMYSYILNKYDEAFEYVPNIIIYANKLRGLSYEATSYLLIALTSLAIYNNVNKKEKIQLDKYIKTALKKIKKWSKAAPMNYLHKYYLISAELAATKGNVLKAEDLFEEAISLARQNGYLFELAIANELCARFYLSLGRTKIARIYILEAHYSYKQWGSIVKTEQLENQYPQLFQQEANILMTTQIGNINKFQTVPASAGKKVNEAFDLATIMKATQSISKQIVINDLLREMMLIVLQNAGAQKGLLVLEKNNEWFVVAEGTTNTGATVLEYKPIKSASVPATIINYVIHTKESLVLDDALHTSNFASDPYVTSVNPKSILTIPLFRHGQLCAVLYLENNLTFHAFPQERINLLNLLSGQIVISIDNAMLYQNLTELNKSYVRFVPKEFLSLLGKNSLVEVSAGDQIQKDMSVLFADIRNFTSLSEKMTPDENFAFINQYLSYMEPIIANHHGFVDKYLGDGVMALFPTDADDALQSAIEMLMRVRNFNERQIFGTKEINIGIGLNSGLLMLGTVGGEHHMEGTVISDVVNVASRIEDLTKLYNISLLITEHTYIRLKDPLRYSLRNIGKTNIRGKKEIITLYEVFDTDNKVTRDLKHQTLNDFNEAISLFQKKNYVSALNRFKAILTVNPYDEVTKYFIRTIAEKEKTLSG